MGISHCTTLQHINDVDTNNKLANHSSKSDQMMSNKLANHSSKSDQMISNKSNLNPNCNSNKILHGYIRVNMDEVDRVTEYLIFGFIREAQRLLPSDTICHIIPKSINYQCIIFYNQPEQFTECPDCIQLDESKMIIKKISEVSHIHTAYGKIHFHKDSAFIYKWKFKIGGMYGNLYIGITSNKRDTFTNEYQQCFAKQPSSKGEYYALGCSGNKYDKINHGGVYAWDYEKKWGHKKWAFKKNNIVTMEVNVKNKTIRFCIKPNELTEQVLPDVLFENIKMKNHKYCMAVTLYGQDASVQLIHFEKIPCCP